MANNIIGNAWLAIKAKADDNFAKELGAEGDTAGGLFNNKFASVLSKLPGIVAGLAIGKKIAQFIGDSIEAGKEFDKAMSQVAATMGKTMADVQADVVTVGEFTGNLRDFAMEMGATTAYSATQAAEALNYMALAGYSTTEAMQALPNVLNLAAAGSMDLARASDMVTDAQSALGLEFEEIEGFVDQLAKTASTTNTSVSQLGDAILTVGGTAKMLKGGTQELNQVLGLLADNGIKGAEGGTALRNMLLSLASPTAEAEQTLKDLGVSVFDAEGNMRSMQDVMGDLNAAMADMTSEQRTKAISNIFNKRDLKSVEALLGTQAERWDEVADAIDNAAGAAGKMAATQLDNWAGDVTLMQSALEGVMIHISDLFVPALRSLTQFATEALSGIAAFMQEHKVIFDTIAGLLGGTLKVVLTVVMGLFKALGEVINFVATILDPLFEVVQAFGDVLAAIFGDGGDADAALEAFFQKVAELPQRLGEAILASLARVGEFVVNLGQKALEGGAKFVQGLLDGLMGAIGAVFSWFSELPGKIVAAIGNPLDILYNVGASIIQGAINGIGSLASALWNKVTSIFAGAVSSAEATIDSHSPSRVFREIGQNMIIGAQLGIEDEDMNLQATVRSTMLDAVDAAPTGLDTDGAVGGDTFVFNITADSETTLQRLVKEAQQARRLYA